MEDVRDPKRFVESWKNAIKTHYDMKKYEKLKEMDPTKEKNLKVILKWKNGGRLLESHEKYINSLLNEWSGWKRKARNGNHLRKKQIKNFLKSREIQGVFDCFLLHLQSPNEYPIIDRHTFRAYCSLIGIEDNKLSTSRIRFQEQYEEYTHFFNKLVKDSKCLRKDVDNALWGYGKYLSISKHKYVIAYIEKI